MAVIRRIDAWIKEQPGRGDIFALALLTLLWALFFWRALTPNLTDQVSLPQGDFSGQFVSFGAYQARRLLAGQIPLWNPYNYAGLPFLADTQAAVFYPPRLFSILISSFLGGWSYSALQAEVIAHYWLASMFTFAFVRTMTSSRTAGLTSAIAFTYGGYLTGYPPLQVAILEAAIWLPLCLLGIFEASEPKPGDGIAQWRAPWLSLSSIGLAVSLMAGHPQTSLFLTYAVIVFMVHRASHQRIPWRPTLLLIVAVCAAGYGMAAVQLLPGLEYTALTTRTNLTFDLRATGFPFSDLVTILIPNVFTDWSPLYAGIPVLILATIAFREREGAARFWGFFALIVLVLSFGAATLAFQLAYLALPGISLFRDQERAVYLVVFAVAVLAGLGVAALQTGRAQPGKVNQIARSVFVVACILALNSLIAKLIWPLPILDRLTQAAFFLAVLLALTLVVFANLNRSHGSAVWIGALVALIVFDLFSSTMRSNWETVPASSRKLLSDLVPVAQADQSLYRVDGRLGLGENYGTLIGMQDINGTSPLRLKALDGYMTLPNYRTYQLLSVKYVFTDWTQLEIPSTVRAETHLGGTKALLHEVTQPMPRAWMVYRVMTTADRGQALGWLADPAFDPASTAILTSSPPVSLPETAPTGWHAEVTDYAPEHIRLDVTTPQNGILVISEMDYPGWQATVDGVSQPILNADAGLRAVTLTAGQHQVELDFRPFSFTIGAFVSLLSIAGLFIVIIASRLKGWGAKGTE